MPHQPPKQHPRAARATHVRHGADSSRSTTQHKYSRATTSSSTRTRTSTSELSKRESTRHARARAMAKEAAAAAGEAQEQWRGAVEARLPSTPASAAWPHVASFGALHRYLPGIDVCELEAGGDRDGRPGCVRYVASLAPGTTTGEVATWAREELLELDGAARRLAYAVVGSNLGFGRYVATMAVVAEEGEEEAGGGCRLVWAFECEPVQGWTRDGLLGYLDGAAKGMAARIEEAVAAGAVDAGGDDVAA